MEVTSEPTDSQAYWTHCATGHTLDVLELVDSDVQIAVCTVCGLSFTSEERADSSIDLEGANV